MKKIVAIVLALLTVAALTACGGNNDKENTETQLGTSAMSVVLPEGYAETEDDLDEDQVAYFFKDAESVDFDVYQWAKGNGYVLEEEAAYYAEWYLISPLRGGERAEAPPALRRSHSFSYCCNSALLPGCICPGSGLLTDGPRNHL